MTQKKITDQEHDNIKSLLSKTTQLNNKRSAICLRKELALRKLNSEFDKNFSSLSLQIDQATQEQTEFMKQLEKKYGKEYNLVIDTGELKKG